MNIKEIEEKIETAKSNKARAEALIERIEGEWKDKHNLNSSMEVEGEILKLSDEITELEKQSKEGMEKLMELVK